MTLPPSVRNVAVPQLRSRLLQRPARTALLLSGCYVAVGAAYIVLSSSMAAALTRNVSELEAVEELKGIAFVVVTGLALFGLVYAGLRRIERHEEDADAHMEALARAEHRALVGLLASSVAHDIRNALSVTNSELELVLESDSLDAGDRPSLEAVKAANQRAIDLTVRLSQVGRERLSGDPDQPFDLARALRDLGGICRHHPALRGHRCSSSGLEQSCVMTGNPLLVARAVTNLMVNAGEAMETPGRVELSLVTRHPDTVEIRVDDSGPGIPMAERERIFAPFHTTKPAGTGVGLMSVRLCAERHGGAAWVEDSPLGGARFVVRLRLRPAAGDA